MKSKTKYFVWTLALLSFLYVSSGGALAFHLIIHDHQHDHEHEHDHGHDHEHNEHNEHDSTTCDTCQNLAVLTKKILVEAPLLLPELSPANFYVSYSGNFLFDQNTHLPVNPRAPPA